MSVYDNERPQIKIPYGKKEKLAILLGVLIIAFNIIYLAMIWSDLPQRMPVHFGGDGVVDAWGNKGSTLILLIVGIILYVFLMGMSAIPNLYNYTVEITKENAEFQYRNARELMLYLATEMVFLFSYIQWGTLRVALGKAEGLGIGFLPISLLIIFGTLGYKIWKMNKKDSKI